MGSKDLKTKPPSGPPSTAEPTSQPPGPFEKALRALFRQFCIFLVYLLLSQALFTVTLILAKGQINKHPFLEDWFDGTQIIIWAIILIYFIVDTAVTLRKILGQSGDW